MSRSTANVGWDDAMLFDLRRRVLSVNSGDVYLDEERQSGHIRVIPSQRSLPRQHDPNAFQTSLSFRSAVARGQAAAVIQTPSGNVLVVPTAPYASIRDFAQKASSREWMLLLRALYATRSAIESTSGDKWSIETIGHDVAHLHFRIVRHRTHVGRSGHT